MTTRLAQLAVLLVAGIAAAGAAARSPTIDARPLRTEQATRIEPLAPPLPDSLTRPNGLTARLGAADRGLPVVTTPVATPSPATTQAQPTKPKVHRHKKKKGPTGQPLTVTPPLEGGPYTFPVTGPGVNWGDTYGVLRTDVPGGWHHGDDIFAPIGAPVVAVADGTLNRVGWQRLGGWRLWVRDRAGDEFYYAHLSGYTPLAMRDGRVRAGEVIGYVGNTGDAFTTLPHVHFEVHPRSLLHLGYNGAVDPTKYLRSWRPAPHVVSYVALHPHFPPGTLPRFEATTNWRELLRALPRRHVPQEHAPPAPPPYVRLSLPRLDPLPLTGFVPRHSPLRWPAVDAIAAVAVLALFMWRRPLDE